MEPREDRGKQLIKAEFKEMWIQPGKRAKQEKDIIDCF